MKKLIALFAMVCAQAAFAAPQSTFYAELNREMLVQSIRPMDLINWKLGDQMSYNMKMAFGSGKSVKEVTKDEGTALWITQVMNILGQNQKAEILINKEDGKILKMIVNGKEQSPDNEQPEIISQEYVKVTVPAGTFDSIHIIAKTKSVSKLEIWANPQATCMDGSVKTIANTQFGAITLELTSFVKK